MPIWIFRSGHSYSTPQTALNPRNTERHELFRPSLQSRPIQLRLHSYATLVQPHHRRRRLSTKPGLQLRRNVHHTSLSQCKWYLYQYHSKSVYMSSIPYDELKINHCLAQTANHDRHYPCQCVSSNGTDETLQFLTASGMDNWGKWQDFCSKVEKCVPGSNTAVAPWASCPGVTT